MKLDDIEGARANPDKLLQKTSFMDPTDINKEFIFKTKRTVDPLEPTYTVRDDTG